MSLLGAFIGANARRRGGAAPAASSRTETIDFATATGAELEVDVTGATRVVVRAVDMIKSGTSNAQLYVTTANGELSGAGDYGGGAVSSTASANGVDSVVKWSNNLTDTANCTLLSEFTGLQAGALFATKTISSSSSNDLGTSMQMIENATDLVTAVLSLRFVDNFTSGTMYIDVITDLTTSIETHDFSTASDAEFLVENMDWMHVTGRDLDGTGSMKLGWRFSDIGAPATFISAGYKQGGQWQSSDDYTATSAMGTYFGTTGAFDTTTKVFNLGSSVIQGSLGAATGPSFAAQNGSIAKITGGISTVSFQQWSDAQTFNNGDIYIEKGTYQAPVVSEGTLAGGTTVAFDVTGKRECHFAFDLTSSGTSDYWGIQFDDGTGYATSTADYDWSSWTFTTEGDRQAFDKVPMCATAGNAGTFTGEIFGLDGVGPTLGWAFGMLNTSADTRASLYHFDGTTLPITGIRFIRNAAETWSGDYSFVANEYVIATPAALEGGMLFLAQATTTQSYDNTVWVDINVTEVLDPEAGLTGAQYTIPASINGEYIELYGGNNIPSETATRLQIAIDRSTDGGSNWDTVAHSHPSGSPASGILISTGVIEAVTGHIYRCQTTTQTANTNSGDQQVFYSGRVIQETAGHDVFYAHVNATQSMTFPGNEKTFGVVVTDTLGAFASSRFTVPAEANGRTAVFEAGWRGGASIIRNGLEIQVSTDGGTVWKNLGSQEYGNTSNTKTSFTGPQTLSTGDIYRVFYVGTTETASNDIRNYFSGMII